MSAARSSVASMGGTMFSVPPRTISVASIPPALVVRGGPPPASGPARRTKIWEFNSNLHCSIVGTCLSTGELRQVLKKLGVAAPDSTDHELHGAAVSLVGRHDKAAKLLHKALDERHRVVINQFAKATTEDAVRSFWRDAVRRGEIPGAYWAALTHPATTQALIRDAFGEVHMLSHLVGAANRADIRRLCELEADNTELRARVERQQVALRDAMVTRDSRIQELSDALTRRIAAEPSASGGGDSAVLRQLVADLERRVVSETRRGAALADKLAAATAALAEERSARAKAEREAEALHRELEVIAASASRRSASRSPPILRLAYRKNVRPDSGREQHDLRGGKRTNSQNHQAGHYQIQPREQRHFSQRHSRAAQAHNRRNDIDGRSDASEAGNQSDRTRNPCCARARMSSRSAAHKRTSQRPARFLRRIVRHRRQS